MRLGCIVRFRQEDHSHSSKHEQSSDWENVQSGPHVGLDAYEQFSPGDQG